MTRTLNRIFDFVIFLKIDIRSVDGRTNFHFSTILCIFLFFKKNADLCFTEYYPDFFTAIPQKTRNSKKVTDLFWNLQDILIFSLIRLIFLPDSCATKHFIFTKSARWQTWWQKCHIYDIFHFLEKWYFPGNFQYFSKNNTKIV